MKSYQLETFAGLESLKLVDLPEPTAAPGKIVVKVHANSLNYRDKMVLEGNYGTGVKTPLIPLSDGAGEIVQVGEGVNEFKVGDRVAGIFMQKWISGTIGPQQAGSAMGGSIDGMLAEYVELDATGVVPMPDHLSYEEAATLPCAAVTAWHALFGHRPIAPGQTVLTLGSGGVSTFAIQFAKFAGARVIGTSSSNEKLERLKELGADDLINYKEHPEWDREVFALTGKQGVDHVVEVGGSGTLLRSSRSVKMGGVISLIGGLSTGSDFEPRLILGKSVTMQGIYVGSRQHFLDMNRMFNLSKIKPVIDKVFPFADAKAAYEHLSSGSHFGKIVISAQKNF